MAYPGLDIATRYLLTTALMIITAKVGLMIFYRTKIKMKERHINQRRALFTQLYSGINAFKVSRACREEKKIADDAFIYGEVMFTPFAELLHLVKPRSGEIVYDLGCGGGKTVFTFALLYEGIEVHGIELLEPLFQLCEDRLEAYQKLPGIYKSTAIEFHHANILDYDFSNGHIIFSNSVCFDRKTWAKILAKFEELPVGARVIVTSKNIVSKNFKLIYSGLILMSWGHNNTFIYEKIS